MKIAARRQENKCAERATTMDMQEFLNNRQQFPPDELAKYAGKHVAWSPDGTSIVASADDLPNLIAALKASGGDPAECVLSSVPESDSLIGVCGV
jgi:hypothetical protein